jgi:O-antigen/teichoic acid export membrane protein
MSHRRLYTNAVSNALGFVAQVVVSFALAPIVARGLGDARYGVWSFTESVLVYLMLFDLGIASALVRYVPRLLAGRDQVGLNRVFSACLAFFTMIAVAAGLIVGLVLYCCPDRFLGGAPAESAEVRLVLFAAVANFATILPLSVFPAMLDGLNAFSIKTLIRTAFLVARIPATLWVIRADSPLLGLILLLTTSNILESLTIAVLVVRKIPGLRFVPRQIDRPTIRMIRGYSIDSFLAMIAGRLTFSTDAFVIGWALGWAAITPFAFANRLVDMARMMLRSTTVTLTPAISASEARGDLRAVRGYFLTGTRLVLYIVLPIEAGLLLLGKPFLARWLRGMDVADLAGPSLWVLAAPLALTIAQSVAARVLYGMGQIRLFARMALAEGVVNLLLSLILVRQFGIVGVAWGTTLPHVGFCLFAIFHAATLLDIRPREYLREWALPAVLTSLPAIIWLFRIWAGAPTWWSEFILAGMWGILPYAAAVAAIEGRSWLAAGAARARHSLIGFFGHHNAPR